MSDKLGNYIPPLPLYTDEERVKIYKKYLRKPDTSGEAYRRFKNRNQKLFDEAVGWEYKNDEGRRAKYTYKDFYKLRESERPKTFYKDWKDNKDYLHYEATEFFRKKRAKEALEKFMRILLERVN